MVIRGRGGSRGWPALLGIRSDFRTGETTILSISITNLIFLKKNMEAIKKHRIMELVS